ncbi:MAG: dihydrodipicolinate reductase [Desulfobacterales bacterium]|nr:dihydrodipicolinate reductase [Desulfobacterales bacterium]
MKVMINGLPGNVAIMLAGHIIADDRFELVPYSLTGPEIDASEHPVDGIPVALVRPEDKDRRIREIRDQHGTFISIDFTHPSAVNDNARFYCANSLPFVMGTTGGDRQSLVQTVEASDNLAVIAPNMAKQIVGFQAMLEFAAENFPGLFTGYTLSVKESHQKGKADTSGTAKAVVKSFNDLGVDFTTDQIAMERDPEIQEKQWGIPRAFLGGHGWHTYSLLSPDETVRFEFTHNINGREVYAPGAMDAVVFLDGKIKQGETGRVYSMIDVLKG